MRYVIGFLMFAHGLIHLMGFIKAFGFTQINQLTQAISKPVGIAWLLTAILMIAATMAFKPPFKRRVSTFLQRYNSTKAVNLLTLSRKIGIGS